MIRNAYRQTGSAHVVIIVILVIAILGVLVGAFWGNFLKPSPATNPTAQHTTDQPTPKRPKSEIIVLKNSDMNKYVNYENHFEFLFPKQIYSVNACRGTDTKFDNYGNRVSSEFHYGVSDGPISATVLEKPGEYIIAPTKTIILSDAKGTGAEGYIYKACNVFATTTDLVVESQKDNFGIKNISLEHRSFTVKSAPDKNAALNVSREIFHDSTGTVNWESDSENSDREVGTFKYTAGTHLAGGFAYKLWYYPSEGKVVFFDLGQSAFFEHPDHSSKYYTDIPSSFKFDSKNGS